MALATGWQNRLSHALGTISAVTGSVVGLWGCFILTQAGTPQDFSVLWATAGVTLSLRVDTLSLFFLLRINNGGSTVGLPPQGVNTAALPDLSQMTPRERFDRLYNRVMQAAETGDAATMQQFSPMALAAFGMLDEVDADARYHAALLKLHTGDVSGSAALADEIEMETPNHLFGFIIRGTLAKWQNDTAALAQVYQEFLEVYDEEIAAERPEYGHHQQSIEGFLQDARGGGG